jgi:hypothetical protein
MQGLPLCWSGIPLHRVSHVRLAERNRGRKTSVGAVVRHAATDGSTPTSGVWGTPASLRVVDCTLVTRFASPATLEEMRVNMTRSQHGETEMMLLAGRKEVDAARRRVGGQGSLATVSSTAESSSASRL